MPRDHRVIDVATQLEMHLHHETELFLCGDNRSFDSEWRIHEYEKDGTQKTVTYEVTEETPPDHSIILKNYDTGDEYVVAFTVTVTKRERD